MKKGRNMVDGRVQGKINRGKGRIKDVSREMRGRKEEIRKG